MSHVIRELLEAIVLALVVFFVIQLSVQNFRVEGHSMQPTLDTGEYLMVTKLPYFRIDMRRLARLVPFWEVEKPEQKFMPFTHPPDRGDVVVFQAPINPSRDFVKRVIGLPGERVRIKDGQVYIDGVRLVEPYLAESDLGGGMECVPHTVGCVLGEGEYFLLGDNRGKSNDSRDWGPAHLEDIVGKVWFVYWPLSNLTFLQGRR